MCYLNYIRSYLWYRGLKLDWKDIRQNVKFSQTLYEYNIPITIDEIRMVLCVSKPEFRFQLLSLLSSGMRVSELGKIKPEQLNLTNRNIMIRLPAEITKTGRSRITFFSRQVSDMIRYRINVGKQDCLFSNSRNTGQFVNLILKRFASARKKAGLTEKYGHCKQNRYHIHVHSMRSYFITKANKIQFGVGHILAGHDFYMKEYNQYTVDELLGMYQRFEKDLTFRQ